MKLKPFCKKAGIGFIVLFFVFGMAGVIKASGTLVDLGVAEDFAVLAGAAISDTNPSALTGNVGLSPTGGTSITGLTCAEVTGSIYDTNAGYAGGGGCLVTNPSLLTTVKADVSSAYNDLNDQTPDTLVDDGDLGGGETLVPGVYSEDGTPDSLAITGELILDGGGDLDSIFIFQSDSTLVTAAGSSITLINGAQACKVFWQVGSSVTLGTNSEMAGTIVAAVSITDNGGSTIEGRLLADANNADADATGAVTLNNTTLAIPSDCKDEPVPVTPATLHVIKVVINDNGGVASSSDFMVYVKDGGTNVTGSPVSGTTTPGTAYTLDAGAYVVSEDVDPLLYTQSFSGACAVDGSIVLAEGDDETCTIANNDVAKIVVGDDEDDDDEGDDDDDQAGEEEADTDTSRSGSSRRRTSNNQDNDRTSGTVAGVSSTTPFVSPPAAPTFPTAGLFPEGTSGMDIVVLLALLLVASGSLVVLKKYQVI